MVKCMNGVKPRSQGKSLIIPPDATELIIASHHVVLVVSDSMIQFISWPATSLSPNSCTYDSNNKEIKINTALVWELMQRLIHQIVIIEQEETCIVCVSKVFQFFQCCTQRSVYLSSRILLFSMYVLIAMYLSSSSSFLISSNLWVFTVGRSTSLDWAQEHVHCFTQQIGIWTELKWVSLHDVLVTPFTCSSMLEGERGGNLGNRAEKRENSGWFWASFVPPFSNRNYERSNYSREEFRQHFHHVLKNIITRHPSIPCMGSRAWDLVLLWHHD